MNKWMLIAVVGLALAGCGRDDKLDFDYDEPDAGLDAGTPEETADAGTPEAPKDHGKHKGWSHKKDR